MQFYPAGQPADLPAGMEESDSDDEPVVASGRHHAKPRRKAHQRPQGSDQIRQAFSKRKKGLVLKSYQLFRLTDAKVFMFVVNDKGSSWAYATPGFGAPLAPEMLRQLRDMAGVGDIMAHAKCHTEVMPHPSIADHDPATDDRSQYVAPRGAACLGSRSAEGAQTTAGFAVPAAGTAARGGRAGSSMSGASGDAELSGDGSRTRATGATAAAAGAPSGTPPKSRGVPDVKEEPVDAVFARPASGLSAVTLAPIPGLPNFSRSAGCPPDAAQAPDMAMADVAPQQLTMAQAQQQQQQYMQQVLPQQQQALFGMPVAGATPGFVMGEAMVELMGPGATGVFVSQPLPLMTGAVAVPLQQLAPLPLAPQMPVGSPPGSPYARPRGPSPGPGAGDPFSSLQSRLTPVRTRLQQGWPEDAGAAQVSSAPAGMVNLMLGPGPMSLVDSTAGMMAPQHLQAQSSPLKTEQQKMVFGTALAGSGATSSGGTPTMGGGPSAATAMFSRFGGPAAAARLADGSTEPSPTASIGRGFAALAVDSMPGTPVYPDAAFMAASGAPAYGPPPAWQDQQMRVASTSGASAPAGCAPMPPAHAAPLAVPLPAPGPDDDAFLDDPILAGLWGGEAPAAAPAQPPASPPSSSLPSPRQLSGSSCCGGSAMASAGMGAMPAVQPVQPMEQQQQMRMQMQMQQVAMQLQALQQQQAMMQQQIITQREQAAATAAQLQAVSPQSGSGAPGTPGSSPVSRERLLDALSAQISAMPPEMRAQLQMQLEGAGPAPPAPPPPPAPADLPPAPPRPLQAAAVAPLPPLANMLHGPSRLSSSSPAAPPASAGAATAAAGPGPAGAMLPPLDCSSPLKRGLPSLGGSLAAPEDGGSPLKRLRARLPEPPSFATLVQTEMSIDDAMAWALQASFSGAVRAPDGSVIAHLGSEDILARLGDPDWAPPAE